MAQFVLQPCKLRDAKFVPQKGVEPKAMDWAELVSVFASSNDARARMRLRQLRPGAFLGLARREGASSAKNNFVFFNPDLSARFDWVFKRDPSLEQRLVEVYRVEAVKWESVVQEPEASGTSPGNS